MPSDLIVMSRLRWDGAWHRLHHIVARLAHDQPTWFAEGSPPPHPGRGGGGDGRGVGRIVWMSTPRDLDAATRLDARVLVYDVGHPPGSDPSGLAAAHKAALAAADVVLTGSSTLHRGVIEQGRPDASLILDGVDPEHFAVARQRAGDRGHNRDRGPVAAYVGPLDRRVDLDLVGALAALLPAWRICTIGPLDGVDAATLPQAANIHHMAPPPYADLPALLADVDVAIIPFAIDAGTSASGVNTLELLAAGLPVVSTPVSDLVTQFGTLIDVEDDARAFADACAAALGQDARRRHQRVAPLLRRRHWDTVADEVRTVLREAGARPRLEDLLA
jgi:glycosyltransferase involved in cell wall biosynthesis